jgi:hypothetical protein
LTIGALELIIFTLILLWGLHTVSVVIEVLGSEVHPLTIFDLEFPRGHSIATELSSEDFKNVVTLAQADFEIELFRFSTIPDVLFLRNDNLAVHLDDASFIEIGWKLEGIFGVALADWELDTVVVSNVFLGTLAESLVAHLFHVLNILLAVTLSGFLWNFLFESADHLNEAFFFVPEEGLDEDRRFFKWFSGLDSAFLFIIDIGVFMATEAANTEDFIRTVVTILVSVAP